MSWADVGKWGSLRCILGRLTAATGFAVMSPSVQAPPTEDDWYANLLWLDRRKCLLLTHDGTLFSVFTADVLKRDLQPFGVYLVRMIEARLREEHLPTDALGELDPDSVRLPARPVAACSAS